MSQPFPQTPPTDAAERVRAVLNAVVTALASGQRSYSLYGTTFSVPIEIDQGRVALAQKRLEQGEFTETARILARQHQIELPA